MGTEAQISEPGGANRRSRARAREIVTPKRGDAAALVEVEQMPSGSPDALGLVRTELADRLRSRGAELQEAVFGRVRRVAPDPVSDGQSHLELGLRKMIAACMDCCLWSIEEGAPWSEPLPPAVAAQASQAASSGVTLTTALRRCVAGYTLAWNFVLGEVAHYDLPDEQRFALLLQASAVMGSLLARVQAEVAEAHSFEIKRKARSHEQRRAEIVQKLLAGELPDDGERAELGYELDAWHLAVIATGADAEKAVRSLAVGLGRQLLSVPHNAESVWAWLGGDRRPVFADIDRVLAKWGLVDVVLAAGEPARGVAGLGVTLREAQGAILVARDSPCRLTRYLDVALDAAAIQDEALADSLIERYLAPLDDMSIGGDTARRTLRALFDTEYNVSSAAHSLKVHRSSVHRWREDIERHLGHRLHKHQAEIEVALRVEALRAHDRADRSRTEPD